MVIGVAYDGGTVSVGYGDGGIVVMASTNDFISVLCACKFLARGKPVVPNQVKPTPRNSFIGSIHGSLTPKVDIFASPCRLLATSVNVRCALTPG